MTEEELAFAAAAREDAEETPPDEEAEEATAAEDAERAAEAAKQARLESCRGAEAWRGPPTLAEWTELRRLRDAADADVKAFWRALQVLPVGEDFEPPDRVFLERCLALWREDKLPDLPILDALAKFPRREYLPLLDEIERRTDSSMGQYIRQMREKTLVRAGMPLPSRTSQTRGPRRVPGTSGWTRTLTDDEACLRPSAAAKLPGDRGRSLVAGGEDRAVYGAGRSADEAGGADCSGSASERQSSRVRSWLAAALRGGGECARRIAPDQLVEVGGGFRLLPRLLEAHRGVVEDLVAAVAMVDGLVRRAAGGEVAGSPQPLGAEDVDRVQELVEVRDVCAQLGEPRLGRPAVNPRGDIVDAIRASQTLQDLLGGVHGAAIIGPRFDQRVELRERGVAANRRLAGLGLGARTAHDVKEHDGEDDALHDGMGQRRKTGQPDGYTAMVAPDSAALVLTHSCFEPQSTRRSVASLRCAWTGRSKCGQRIWMVRSGLRRIPGKPNTSSTGQMQ